MTDTDYAIALKLRRSIVHLKHLERTIKRFLNGNANEVVNDFQSEPGYLIVKVISYRPPPRSCSLLIGDVLYHQRAALDYTACELARYNEQVVDDHVEYPIFLDRDDFRNPVSGQLTPAIVSRIGLLAQQHQTIIEEQQPFQQQYGEPEDDPLAILYRLSNYDRHQFLHLTSVITNASFHDFTPTEAAARFEQVSVSYGAFKSEAEVAKFRIRDGPELDVHVQSNVRFDVAFDEKGPGAGRPVLKTLGSIGMRVGEAIRDFNWSTLP